MNMYLISGNTIRWTGISTKGANYVGRIENFLASLAFLSWIKLTKETDNRVSSSVVSVRVKSTAFAVSTWEIKSIFAPVDLIYSQWKQNFNVHGIDDLFV